MTAQATPPSGRALPPSAARPAAARRPARRRRRFSILAALGYLVIAVVFIGITAATFLTIAPPTDIVRERLITEFRSRTGYVLEINGTTTFQLLPSPSIEFRDVVVATASEGGSPVLRVESVEVEALVSALLWGKVQAERVLLRRPQLDLVIDAEGRRKWLRADAGSAAPRPVRLAQLGSGGTAGRFSMPGFKEGGDEAAEPESPSARSSSGRTPFPAIRISDGIVRYRDLRTGSLTQADQIQLRFVQRTSKQGAPIHGRGSFAYAGETVKVDVEAEPPEGRRARALERVTMRVDGRHGKVRYDGSVILAGQAGLSGTIDVTTPQARDAARWLGAKSRDSGFAGPVALKARIDAGSGLTRLDDLQFKIDGVQAAGRIDVAFADTRPRFSADLEFAELDFDLLRKTLEARQAARAQSKRGASPEGDGESRRERRRDVRRVEAAPARPAGEASPDEEDAQSDVRSTDDRSPRTWRTDPIPFLALRGADGEARLRATKLVWRGAMLTDAVGALTLNEGGMKVDIREGAMHGGRAKGVITASAAGHVAIDLALDDVSAFETLSNSGRFEVLDGRARIRLAVAGHGATEKEIVDTLAGSASLDIANGAIVGWSVDEIIATARRLEIPNLERNPNARTPFSRLVASLDIKDGVAAGKEMRIAATPVSLDSSGTIDLKARTLDLTLNPRLATEAAAKGGDPSRLAALTVPLRLIGPWNRPRLSADYSKILKSPQKVIDAARDVARGVKEEDIDKAAKRFLGDTPEAEKGAKRAKDILRKLLQ
jgi:uncharacterized protein involved in outer membrane biogenesis